MLVYLHEIARNVHQYKPLVKCKVEVLHGKNSKSYRVEFVVVNSDRAIPILGNPNM